MRNLMLVTFLFLVGCSHEVVTKHYAGKSRSIEILNFKETMNGVFVFYKDLKTGRVYSPRIGAPGICRKFNKNEYQDKKYNVKYYTVVHSFEGKILEKRDIFLVNDLCFRLPKGE